MLKRVVFILKKENVLDGIKELLIELTEHDIHTFVVKADDISKAVNKTEKKEQTAKQAQECLHTEETLYITDSAVCYKTLKSGSLPTIVYLHEGSRGEDFSQAAYVIEQIEEIEYRSLELAWLRLTGQPWDIFTTNRCKIRETTTDDADSFYEIYKDPSITYYMEDLYADRDEEIAYIKDYIKNVYGFYGYGMWTVLEKTSGRVIGRAGISLREGYDIPELGFVIAVPYQRQGYAYEVCRAILAYGEEELDFTRFQVLIMVGNEKSKALCKKLGFVYQDTVEIDGAEYERMIWEKKETGLECI